MRMNKASGFTLLEMLLTLGIMTLLLMTAWQLLNQVSSARDTLAGHEKRLSDIDMAFLLIKQDFRQQIDRGVRVDGSVSGRSIFHGDQMLATDDQAISFVRTGWRNPGQQLPRSEQQRVYYRLKNNVLERGYDLILDTPENTDYISRPLLDGVDNLKFYFFYNGNWSAELEEDQHPGGIRVVLQLQDLGMIQRDFELPVHWEDANG